jgi:hypothetical protein
MEDYTDVSRPDCKADFKVNKEKGIEKMGGL